MAVRATQTTQSGELPPRLVQLIDEPRHLTAIGLWRALEREERTTALRLLVRRRRNRRDLDGIVADQLKGFRRTTIAGWKPDEIVKKSLHLRLPDWFVKSLLREIHEQRRREMLARFLSALGIPNDDGVVIPNEDGVAEGLEYGDLGETKVHGAADDLVREHGLRRSVVYFLTLAVLGVPFRDHLQSWLETRWGAATVADDVAAPGVPIGASPSEDSVAPAVSGAQVEPDGAGDSVSESIPPPFSDDVAEQLVAEEPTVAGVPVTEGEAGRGEPMEVDVPQGDTESVVTDDSEVIDGPGPTARAVVDPQLDAIDHSRPSHSLQILDDLLIRAIVDSLQGVEGSLGEDDIVDAVDELIHLNSSRHQSYFHAGYRDVLFRRSLARELPAENETRRRWYWSGAILGWGRRCSWQRIVEAYDANSTVRNLGNGADPATHEAAPHIADALSREGRAEDIPDFVRVRGLVASPTLCAMVFDIGTRLLHKGEVAQAERIFDRLMDVVRLSADMEAVELGEKDAALRMVEMTAGLEVISLPDGRRLLDIRRRLAHCLQQLLEHDRAHRLLEELLDLEEDPNHLAMIHADLGLIGGMFTSLEDVSLPSRSQDLPNLLERLRSGSEHYRQSSTTRSADKNVPYAAHGDYCLGLLALADEGEGRDRYARAAEHLNRARTQFSARRGSYGDALVFRTELYLGVARAASAESGDLAHAARLMTEALGQGADFPRYLIDPVVEGLRMGSETDELANFATALLRRHGDDALDALSKSETVLRHCGAVCDRLRERALLRGASEVAAADYRRCLSGYLKAGRFGEAADVLDRLEDLARQRVGAKEFLELLAESGYQRAWKAEDAAIARAGVHEARGEIDDAFTELDKLFWSFLGHPNRLHDAEGILERIRRLGVEDHYFERHGNALAARTDEPAAEIAGSVDRPPVKVLFVGGDERQAKARQAVENRVRREAPHIEVTFVFPGWSGNWTGALNDVRGKIKTHDAMALMRLVRTEFGRQCRKCCNTESKPWRSCWVAGQRAMADSIIAAANAAG